MIRYAAHRVYMLKDASLLERQIVELDESGGFVGISPFSMEVHHTIWVDGIIIISETQPECPQAGESFEAYTGRLYDKTEAYVATDKKIMRAYQISGLDIPAMRFITAGKVTLLI